MPTYVYACTTCNESFEVDQRISEPPLETCNCGSTGTVKRVIQPIAVMFKGAGFHINDYAGKAADALAKADAPAEAAPAAAPSCTGDQSTCACSAESSE